MNANRSNEDISDLLFDRYNLVFQTFLKPNYSHFELFYSCIVDLTKSSQFFLNRFHLFKTNNSFIQKFPSLHTHTHQLTHSGLPLLLNRSPPMEKPVYG